MEEKLTSVEYDQLGRVLTILMPDLVKEIEMKYKITLTDQAHIPAIWEMVNNTFIEMDQFDKYIMLTAVVYSLYSPASLIGCANAPANMRKAIAEVISCENGTLVNHWFNIARAHVKNARYVAKMNIIINQFKN